MKFVSEYFFFLIIDLVCISTYIARQLDTEWVKSGIDMRHISRVSTSRPRIHRVHSRVPIIHLGSHDILSRYQDSQMLSSNCRWFDRTAMMKHLQHYVKYIRT